MHRYLVLFLFTLSACPNPTDEDFVTDDGPATSNSSEDSGSEADSDADDGGSQEGPVPGTGDGTGDEGTSAEESTEDSASAEDSSGGADESSTGDVPDCSVTLEECYAPHEETCDHGSCGGQDQCETAACRVQCSQIIWGETMACMIENGCELSPAQLCNYECGALYLVCLQSDMCQASQDCYPTDCYASCGS